MIERIELFTTNKERLLFLLTLLFISSISLGFKYYSYKQFTAFDSQLVEVEVLKQYIKTKQTIKGYDRTYQVLKLKTDDGLSFYTIASKNLEPLKDKKLKLEIWAGDISFLEYLQSFFAYGKILSIEKDSSLRERVSQNIDMQHQDSNISQLYNALYLAKPLSFELQKQFSSLGISHLIAISGFHLGLLSAFFLLLIRYPYKFLQNRYFPYRNYKRDSFLIIGFVLFFYMLFVDTPPSLLRAFVMMLVGFILYDRGVKIISMETLFVAVSLILALFPALLFSIGLWLSVAGVFYIFLFLIHYDKRSNLWKLCFLPIWVYIMMLPYALVIFENFSLYHPLSILLTTLFTLFYPLSLLLHFFHLGNLLDALLQFLMYLNIEAENIKLHWSFLAIEILFSLIAIKQENIARLLLFYCCSIFIYSIYYVAEF
ncbi:MAG: ComEC/Rec2 family competence protein [Campylobacterales bacterium]|nr:ComEC/Rec2 family competence protein [Campylobacterales bacterium]